METLSEFTPNIEYYSIDEAFLSLDGFESRNLTDYAKHIQKTVKQWTGMPVSVGVATTKTLAKIANKLAKRNPSLSGVLDISRHPQLDNLLSEIPVEKIWGIGSQYSKLLHQNGIHNAKAFKEMRNSWVKEHMTVVGLRTKWELNGISCIPLEEMTPPKKGIVSSRSFGKPVESLSDLKEALATYITRAAEKLRSQNCVTEYVHVFVTTNRFKPGEPQYANSLTAKLPVPSANTSDLLSPAQRCLEKIYRPGYRYKKTGVMLTGIIPANEAPLSLFTPVISCERKNEFMKTIDKINKRWGRDTIETASTGIEQPWRMRRAKVSPRYTTQWNEIAIVKAG